MAIYIFRLKSNCIYIKIQEAAKEEFKYLYDKATKGCG